MRPHQLVATLLSLAPLAVAWPNWMPEPGAIIARQDTTATSTSSSTRATQTSTTSGARNTAATTTGATSSSASGVSGNSTTTRPEINDQDPAGSVNMLTPAPTAALATPLYKVMDTVTWGWNYTDLQVAPTAIDVVISCADATKAWTLTQNMTYATKVDFTWDTNNNMGTPYVVNVYTLLIYDADGSPTGTAAPGYLAPYAGFKFGVYTRQPYTPLASGWKCVSCSGAVPGLDKSAWSFALFTSVVTVMTFNWFVTGAGVAF